MILRQFINLLGKNYSLYQWLGAKPSTRNIISVSNGEQNILLYVKVRGKPPGFWGLTNNRIKELESSGENWGVVLLVGSPENGYFLDSEKVINLIKNGEINLAGDGDYKVNENSTTNLGQNIT